MTDYETLKSDQNRLITRLSNLNLDRRTIFAAACAERLYPLFEHYCARTGRAGYTQLRNALDILWDSIGSAARDEEFQELAEQCEKLIPSQNDKWFDENIFADDAAAAAAYALRARVSQNPQIAAWSAERGTEVAHHFVHDRDKLSDDAAGLASVIASHEYQLELSHQKMDLEELEGALNARGIIKELAYKIRDRAAHNAAQYRF